MVVEMEINSAIRILLNILTSSLFISILVAILTVTGTLWLQDKRQRINALRSLKSEVDENRHLAARNVDNLRKKVEGISELESLLGRYYRFRPATLHTSAFDSVKNSGLFLTFQKNTQEAIQVHYRVVNDINRQIMLRRNLMMENRFSMRSEDDVEDGQESENKDNLVKEEQLDKIARAICKTAVRLRPEEARDTYYQRISGIDRAEWAPVSFEPDSERDIATPEYVLGLLDKELNEYRILKRIF